MEVEILCQVKQQQQKKKKKISKWRCVVCNQMQSVCKVFAQGFIAKDLRGFVQSFNMSRAITQPSPLPLPQFREEEEEDIVRDDRIHNNKRRSSDWSQFLDPVEVEEQQVEEESDFEPKIVTELPQDLFKKQKLNANADLLYNRNSTAKNVISPSNSLFFFSFLVMWFIYMHSTSSGFTCVDGLTLILFYFIEAWVGFGFGIGFNPRPSYW